MKASELRDALIGAQIKKEYSTPHKKSARSEETIMEETFIVAKLQKWGSKEFCNYTIDSKEYEQLLRGLKEEVVVNLAEGKSIEYAGDTLTIVKTPEERAEELVGKKVLYENRVENRKEILEIVSAKRSKEGSRLFEITLSNSTQPLCKIDILSIECYEGEYSWYLAAERDKGLNINYSYKILSEDKADALGSENVNESYPQSDSPQGTTSKKEGESYTIKLTEEEVKKLHAIAKLYQTTPKGALKQAVNKLHAVLTTLTGGQPQ